MCACRQKKSSFFIEDILKDAKKTYKNISSAPSEPLTCSAQEKPVKFEGEDSKRDVRNEREVHFDVICEVDKELEYAKINLEHRRNTFPLYPTALKPSFPWPPYRKEVYERQFNYFSDTTLNSDHILRTQLAANRFVPPYVRQPYGYDRGKLIIVIFLRFMYVCM